MFRRLSLALAGLALMAGTASASVEVFAIDPAHSEASFQVRHIVTKVRGRFTDLSGAIRVDRDNPAASEVEFLIKAASIDTANERRDNHLRSPDFFDVEKHPEISFRSSGVEPTGDDTYAVTGTLTIHGVSKEIVLYVQHLGFMKGPRGGEKGGFETAVTLDRKEYGIVWNRALDTGGFILGDEVKVEINLEVSKQEEKPEEK
jgi:polyisoprenoid-binding protein YceI